ncbi:MAG: orange carotenoid protein N-terminal domain-containing protein [Cyanobacteria bacterium P01_C01_bin.121]
MKIITDALVKQSAGISAPVPSTLADFAQLSTDEKLGLLWFVYEQMGKGSVTPAATGAARLQFAEGLLGKIKALSADEQLSFMQDLVEKRNTPLTRAYGLLTNNTKLAFWYQLAECMRLGDVIAVPAGYILPYKASILYKRILGLQFGEQISVLRQAVVDMGYDPFS